MEVGILGGGQLGRMLALAGYPLGVQLRGVRPCARRLRGASRPPYMRARIRRRRRACPLRTGHTQVITYEFENVPVETARHGWAGASGHLCARRPARLELFQDRLLEKQFLQRGGHPHARVRAHRS
jgi:5-(carboxyamino)imidazole ribonucleotide synthase